MRVALILVAGLVAGGCGNGGSGSNGSVLSAAFGNLSSANTSGVGISTPTVGCFYVPQVNLACKAYELPDDKGREIDVTIFGAPVAGMDYPVTTSGMNSANVTFFDPTTLGTASGLRQWNAVDGTGVVHITTFEGGAIAFTYGASMQAFGSPATGSFDVSGAATVAPVQLVQ